MEKTKTVVKKKKMGSQLAFVVSPRHSLDGRERTSVEAFNGLANCPYRSDSIRKAGTCARAVGSGLTTYLLRKNKA